MQYSIKSDICFKVLRIFFAKQIDICKNSIKRIMTGSIYSIPLSFPITIQTD